MQTTAQAGLLRMAGFAFVDLGAAALALYVLLPHDLGVTFPLVFAAYVLAVGAGLISNAPAGLGAFDAALCLLLMITPDAAFLAAILGFRLTYYAIPAVIAAIWLIFTRGQKDLPSIPALTPPHWDLLRQGGRALRTREGIWLVRKIIGATIAIGGPIQTNKAAMSPAILRKRIRPRLCAIYKCDARTALSARKLGWQTTLIAKDAVIAPQSWSTATPAFRQLRRKLAQATKANVMITTDHDHSHGFKRQLAQISEAWAQTNGGEMGFSMGRWHEDYVANQRVYLIWADGVPCGFVTFQTRADVWALDLIRFAPRTPNGAVHMAIVQAINDAALAGISTLNLGAVPVGTHRFAPILARNRTGLRQFKSAFHPRWVSQYHCAPTTFETLITGALVLVSVQNIVPRLMMIMRKRIGHIRRVGLRPIVTGVIPCNR
jgi:phosphatidylglycerol lysyltransferase